MIWPEETRKWWNLNREEVERRAAALNTSSPACANCAHDAMTAIEQIRVRLHAAATTLHLTVDGGGAMRMVQITNQIRVSGQTGSASVGMQNDNPATDIRLRVPARLLGRNDPMISGLVISPGFKTAVIESAQLSTERIIPVRLTPISSKTLTGTVTFQNARRPSPFSLWVTLHMTQTNVSGDIHSGGSVLQRIAEGAVDENGRFSISIPDITMDPILNAPGNWFELTAQPNSWVLEPSTIQIDRKAEDDLELTAAPRGQQPARP